MQINANTSVVRQKSAHYLRPQVLSTEPRHNEIISKRQIHYYVGGGGGVLTQRREGTDALYPYYGSFYL
jgi:hypothetical protein